MKLYFKNIIIIIIIIIISLLAFVDGEINK